MTLNMPWSQPMPVLVSALGPTMLKVAGELADGTVTWMAGVRTVESFVTPRIKQAAEAAARPAPRIAVGLPVAVCDDEAAGREAAVAQFTNYANAPHYRRLIDMEGGSIGDVAIAGDEKSVERQLRALAAAGATHLYAYPFPVGDDPQKSAERTRALLTSLVGKVE
jgi:alkanesulfonate monooxygenase SsuD/methylene tetrahydromethanopterin reductase-like flavin-dependent oxidoreductase (luciferase family)